MASAVAGVRIVARALPGSGGSAARARASAACFAACRAAHGAAPRRPSLRFGGSGFLSTFDPAVLAPFFAEALASTAFPFAGFLLVAISVAVIVFDKSRSLARRIPLSRSSRPQTNSEIGRVRTAIEFHYDASVAILTVPRDDELTNFVSELGLGSLERKT